MKLRKIIAFIFFLSFLTTSCNDDLSTKQSDDFNILMGENKSVWKFIKTHEDYKNLHLFKKFYEKNKHLIHIKQKESLLPPIIHFIWLGPNPYPRESIENIYSWVENHPNWTFKFWTDRQCKPPHPQMQLHLVSNFTFTQLGDLFQESDNYGEKTNILRYEILNQEGGLYVDHDVQCFKSFFPLHSNFDFYCSLKPPHHTILSSSCFASNSIIGAHPHHPIMQATIDRVKKKWKKCAMAYPNNDKDSIVYRVIRRSMIVFDDAIKKEINKNSNKDIVLPAAFFHKIDDDFGFFSHHSYASTWFKDDTQVERTMRHYLLFISRRNNQILLFNAFILSVNLVLFICLLFQYRLIKKQKNDN